MKELLKYVKIYVLLMMGLFTLMILACAFPSTLIKENVIESSEQFLKEGMIYKIFEDLDIKNDTATDSLMINEAYSIDNENIIYSFMGGRKNYNRNITTVELKDINGELISFSAEVNLKDENSQLPSHAIYDTPKELFDFVNDKVTTSVNYSRYWHGYLIFLRPLLIFFNVMQIRNIFFVVLSVLFVWLMYLLNKRFGFNVAFIFGISLILNGYFFIGYSLQGISVFLIMMISSIVLIKKEESIKKQKNIFPFIFVVGGLTSFFDYLTVPLLTCCVPLIIYILMSSRDETNIKNIIIDIIKVSFSWGIGYVGIWVSKWLIYDLIYDEQTVKSAIKQVLYRTHGENMFFGTPIDVFLKWAYFRNLIYICMIAIWIIYGRVFDYKLKENSLKIVVPMILISFYPLAWFLILANHSSGHMHFSYRNMTIFLITILLCLNSIFEIKLKKK